MARIELRDATIRIRDGLAGTALVNDAMATAGENTIGVDTIALNTAVTTLIPIGARFTISGEAGLPIHTVLTRTPSGSGPTTSITFSPVLAAGGVADNAPITFQPIQIEVKIGDGNLTYTENVENEYLLDKGNLDTVREGNEVPMDVQMDFVYEFVKTGTNEPVSVVDAIKGKGGAAEWVSSSPDKCEPYAVDLEVTHDPPCGTAQNEVTLFPQFRRDSLEFDLGAATIACQGRCNATEPTITRV